MEFVNAIETKIISTTTVSWNFWYGLLEKFTVSEGHARPTDDHKEDGYNLGSWVQVQRGLRYNLTPERLSRLETLPGWVWDISVFQWEEGFLYLQKFTASEGHARPPKIHKEYGYNLGIWVTTQRSSRNNVTPQRIARLEALPGWAWDNNTFRWEEGFSALQKFTASEGHARPPKKHKEDGYNLGSWVQVQRRLRYNLTPERLSRLEALPGWLWDVWVFQWEEGFSYLQRFTASKGHARPPFAHKEEGYNLGTWVIEQRTNRDNLTPERLFRLEALPGWAWDGNAFQWEEGFSCLQRFTASEGHSRPPNAHKENGYNLGQWVSRQRSDRNTLTPERITRLEALPGWAWDNNTFRWEEGFLSLQRFTAREGHARPLSSRKENGNNLGSWVLKQRRSRNNLTPERIALLEALPGWVWDVLEFQWEEGFSALQRFTAREGHARPLSSHKENGNNLGSWVVKQRFSSNNLTPERIARLGALPGWAWDGNAKRPSA
jgi:hypothetical protein